MTDVKATGERIRNLRKAKGWTQTDLGNRIGVQNSAIAKYENGRVPNLKRSIIKALAKALDVSPSYLLGLDEEPEYLQAYRHMLEPAEDPARTKLLQIYDGLDDRGKDKLVAYAEGLSALSE